MWNVREREDLRVNLILETECILMTFTEVGKTEKGQHKEENQELGCICTLQ